MATAHGQPAQFEEEVGRIDILGADRGTETAETALKNKGRFNSLVRKPLPGNDMGIAMFLQKGTFVDTGLTVATAADHIAENLHKAIYRLIESQIYCIYR
jgi:hypothetical protein